MAKSDLITEAEDLKLPLTGEETVAELEDMIAKAKDAGGPSPVSKAADYSFATNVVKLNRAKAYVAQSSPDLKGKALEAAVKERYVELKGLLAQDKPTARRKNANVQNMADNNEE